MPIHRFAFVLFLILAIGCFDVSAKTVRDTLLTSDGDRIIITYELSVSGNQYTVRFDSQQKKLGLVNGGRFKELGKVAVMFFDRTGGYTKEVSITNMVPEAFMVPSKVIYKRSTEGYFVVQDNPMLTFEAKEDAEICIPVYLAYHPKKSKYILFSKSNDMVIRLNSPSQAGKPSVATQIVQETISSTAEIEADNSDAIKVLDSISLAEELLCKEDKLPFSETLQDEIRYLRLQKREVSDDNLVSQITDILRMYDEKKASLEEKALAEQIAAQMEAEEQARLEAEEKDSIEAARKEQNAKDKKRNIILIFGGCIAAFLGNQAFQSIRNAKNQRNIMDVQQSIANKAEAEAERRARKAVRSTMNKTINHSKSEARKAVRKKTTITVNGKTKNLSI